MNTRQLHSLHLARRNSLEDHLWMHISIPVYCEFLSSSALHDFVFNVQRQLHRNLNLEETI
jgi:hypothetical protein